MSNHLRSHIIRLAHRNPALRPHLLPLLGVRVAAEEKVQVINENGRKVWVNRQTLRDPVEGKKYKSIKEIGEGGGGGKPKIIKDDKGGKHRVIPAKGGHTLFMGSYTDKHITEHNKPGKGSVFNKGVNVDDIAASITKDVPKDFFEKGGGIFTTKVKGAGKDLVQKVSDIRKKHPNAREIEIEKQEGVVMEDDPDKPGAKRPKKGPDGKPIPNMVKAKAFVLGDDEDGSEYDTDEVNVIMRPANPMFMPDEAKGPMKGSIDKKKGFAVLSAFPGNPNVPKTSEWGDDWAVIIPSGGKGAEADVQEAIKKSKEKGGKGGKDKKKTPADIKKDAEEFVKNIKDPEARKKAEKRLKNMSPEDMEAMMGAARSKGKPAGGEEEGGKTASLRSRAIRLAYLNSALRPHLLPLLTG